MGTGHDGSMTTVHSNNPRECIGRLETLVQYAGAGLSPKAIKEMIANAVHMIIQQSRLDDGSRRVTYVTEVAGMQGEVVTLQDIFTLRKEDLIRTEKFKGSFKPQVLFQSLSSSLRKKDLIFQEAYLKMMLQHRKRLHQKSHSGKTRSSSSKARCTKTETRRGKPPPKKG